MKRLIVFIYGIISYLLFLGAFLYAIGFVGNLLVPKSIDSGETGALGMSLLINALILGLFAVQHSIMARPWFKEILTKIIPQAAERSTFVLFTSLIFFLMFWQWRPLGDIVWQFESGAAYMALTAFFWIGWAVVLVSTFLVNHFDLFGLQQITSYLNKKEVKEPEFTDRSLYKYVRHPIMLGFLIAFWATPTMSVGHLFFTVMCTGYIIAGVWFEEADLKRHFGERYIQYCEEVPMLIPFTKFSRKKPSPQAEQQLSVGEN